MRVVNGISHSLLRLPDGKPHGEITIYTHEGEDDRGRRRNEREFRFFAAPEGFRHMAEYLNEAADKLEAMPKLVEAK